MSQGDQKDGEMQQSRMNWSRSFKANCGPKQVQGQVKLKIVSPWLAVNLATSQCLLLLLPPPALWMQGHGHLQLEKYCPSKPNSSSIPPSLLLIPECRLYARCFHPRMAIHSFQSTFFFSLFIFKDFIHLFEIGERERKREHE